jgi:hypothetical protein
MENKRYTIALVIIDNYATDKLPELETGPFPINPVYWRTDSYIDNLEDFSKDILRESESIIKYFNKIKDGE